MICCIKQRQWLSAVLIKSVRESSSALCWLALHSEVDVDVRVTEWTNSLSFCLQIIRLINVFTPQKSLEEFQDL